MNIGKLDALARSLTGPFAFCGIAVSLNTRKHFAISQQPFLSADANTMFRVASISKVIVGRAVSAFVDTKATSWDADISDIVGWQLRHPDFPDLPVTLGMIAGHHAGLDDTAGYQVPADLTLREWCRDRDVFSHPPGTYFSYANLGYLLLAEALEALSGMSFPQAVASFLPAGSGFNWIGVAPTDRAKALATYRRDGHAYIAQVDEVATLPDMAKHVGHYAPQGGLRTSLAGLLEMAAGLRDADPTRLWTPQSGDGNYLDGVFESYGAGLQIYDTPRFYPRPLIGHFGKAYGFNGGVWHDRHRDLSFVYALNGLEIGDESDAFSAAERVVFDTIARI